MIDDDDDNDTTTTNDNNNNNKNNNKNWDVTVSYNCILSHHFIRVSFQYFREIVFRWVP